MRHEREQIEVRLARGEAAGRGDERGARVVLEPAAAARREVQEELVGLVGQRAAEERRPRSRGWSSCRRRAAGRRASLTSFAGQMEYRCGTPDRLEALFAVGAELDGRVDQGVEGRRVEPLRPRRPPPWGGARAGARSPRASRGARRPRRGRRAPRAPRRRETAPRRRGTRGSRRRGSCAPSARRRRPGSARPREPLRRSRSARRSCGPSPRVAGASTVKPSTWRAYSRTRYEPGVHTGMKRTSASVARGRSTRGRDRGLDVHQVRLRRQESRPDERSEIDVIRRRGVYTVQTTSVSTCSPQAPRSTSADLADRRVGLHGFEDERDEVVRAPGGGVDATQRRGVRAASRRARIARSARPARARSRVDSPGHRDRRPRPA